MKSNLVIIFYNSSQVSESQGLVELADGYHIACAQLNQSFLKQLQEQLQEKLPEDQPILVLNAQAELPPFHQQRMANAESLPEYVRVVSALSSQFEGLSPIQGDDEFKGTVSELDQLLYLTQKPAFFPTSQLNTDAFWIRNRAVLSEVLDDRIERHAFNHCLIQTPESPVKAHQNTSIGDQNPLPAHPLAAFRFRLNELAPQRADYPRLDGKPVVLHITMNWGGGVHKWIDDFIEHHDQYHHLVWVSMGELYRQRHGERFQLLWQGSQGLELSQTHMSRPIKATEGHNPEYLRNLEQIVKQWQVGGIVVSSLIGHAMDCLDTGLPTLRMMHDYFPQWPSLNAQLDAQIISDADMDAALAATEDEPFGLINESEWRGWQKNHSQKLQQSHVTVTAPSQSVIKNLLKLKHSEVFNTARITPHGIKPISPIEPQQNAMPLTVLFLGRINPPKGQIVLDHLLDITKGNDDLKFVFLGAGNEGKKYLPNPQVKVIMDYQHDELQAHLEDIQPHLALILSQTSETFSYVLSELQSAAIPVLATSCGALKERISDGRTGLFCANDAEAIAQQLNNLQADRKPLSHIHQQLKAQNVLDVSGAMKAFDGIFNPRFIERTVDIKSLQIEDWVAKVSLAQNQMERHHLRWLASEKDLTEKTEWAKQLSEQVEHLSHNIDLNQQEKEHLLKTVDELKQAMQNNEERHAEEAFNLNQNISNLQGEKQKLEMGVNDLNTELTGVYQSRSWRMTRPLRQFTTWARHKRNAIKFRAAQIKSWPKRGLNSLRSRGLVTTVRLAFNKFKRVKPKAAESVSGSEISLTFEPLKLSQSDHPVVSVVIPVFNHFEHTYHCLKSLATLSEDTPFEVIVIDDCSDDDTPELIQLVSGIRYHRQQQNGGFIESCNTGAQLAAGEFLLFLNNDTEVHKGGIDALINTFESHHDAGLVGSQLIYPDGRLQEAGGIVFNDASGWNYGRLDDPNKPQYQHVREVTYCSGASIMIRKQLFEQLGCFDERYKPAYYEDTDLAFSVRNAGLKVYYQPASRVTHFEGISSGTDLTSGTKKYQVINQEKFLAKWQDTLKNQPQNGSDIELARFQNQPKRVLIFDACTPTPDQDSGSLRMINLMRIFNDLGYQVSFIPENMAHFENYTSSLQQLGVECIYSPSYSSPVDYLKRHGRYFDVVLLSRYYVAEPVMPMIRDYCPKAQLLFDTVDLHYLREIRMAEVAEDDKQLNAAHTTKLKELAVAKACDTTLVVSPYEQSVLAEETPELDVQILSNIHEVYGCLKGFDQRQDLVFIGGYQHTPNVDGILWFVEAIWPTIKTALPEIKLHIVGSKAPKEVKNLGALPDIVFHGFVEDIEPVMSDYRIAVAPLRFGAGVKGKVNMSMSYGQPVVGTAVAVEGMYTQHGKDVLMSDDPVTFAQHVIELYQDKDLWQQISQGGLANVEQHFSFNAAKKQIETILT